MKIVTVEELEFANESMAFFEENPSFMSYTSESMERSKYFAIRPSHKTFNVAIVKRDQCHTPFIVEGPDVKHAEDVEIKEDDSVAPAANRALPEMEESEIKKVLEILDEVEIINEGLMEHFGGDSTWSILNGIDDKILKAKKMLNGVIREK